MPRDSRNAGQNQKPRPVAFVKQANIANGPQQINNGSNEANNPVVRAREETETAQNALLADTMAAHGKPIVTRAKRKAGRSNPRVATVETDHRAANG